MGVEEHVRESQKYTVRAEVDQVQLEYTGETREYCHRQVDADFGSFVIL